MKFTIKSVMSLLVGAFSFMFALTLPATDSAEAYTNYYTNYTPKYYNYAAYNPSNYNTNSYANDNYQKTTGVGQPETKPSNSVNTSDEQAMLNLINKERTGAGLQPLTADAKLTQLARLKARDMIDNNYFSHTSPTYGSPFDMMKNNGVTYRYAGENLAGASDVNTAHTNLMNSAGHKANIMKPEYSKVGIGVVNGGPYGKMYVQEFNG